jgi:hypothetical protein
LQQGNYEDQHAKKGNRGLRHAAELGDTDDREH